MKHQVFALLVNLLLNYVFSQEIQVKTKYGWLEGNYSTTRGGRQIIEFLGIKYAKSPTGELRFKSPEPIEPWEGVRQATKECDACTQQLVIIEALKDIVSGSEDCLCLNVYTPNVTSHEKLPVIVFIHGGAYMGFSSDKTFYGPELLLDRNVVLVTLNYRLGVLGFLSTEDDIIPGNYGLKDQALALKWVQDNIAMFGGDPHSVTLMGESAGAGSVYLHMMSPASQRLFHKAIAHSGSSRCPWAIAKRGTLKNRAAQLAKDIGCPFTPSKRFLSCLQNIPAEKIVGTTNHFLVWDMDPIVIWYPVLEPVTAKNTFLTKDHWNTPSYKPLLAGFNFAEGGLKTLSVTRGDVEQKFKKWNNNFQNLTAFSLLYDKTAPDPAAVTKAVRKFYFGNINEISPNMTSQITKLYGDFWLNNGILDAVQHHRGLKFLYYFNYNTSTHFSMMGALLNNPIYLGVSHFDEMAYFFPLRGGYKFVDTDLSLKLVEMWSNFVRKSYPSSYNITWHPVMSNALEYLEISNKGLNMKSCPIEERRRFYKTLKLSE